MAIPTITNNTPQPGHITWGAFNIQLNGVAYSVAAGSTNQRWVWWEYRSGVPIINAGMEVPSGVYNQLQNSDFARSDPLDPTLPLSWLRAVPGVSWYNVAHTTSLNASQGTVELKTGITNLKGPSVSQLVNLVPGATYRVTFRAKASAAVGGFYAIIMNAAGNSEIVRFTGVNGISIGTGWATYTGTAVVPVGAATQGRLFFLEYNAPVNNIVSIDDVSFGFDAPAALVDDDLVLFANKNGIGVRVQSTNFVDGELLVDGSIFAEALSTNLINSKHIVTAGLDAGVIKFGEMSGDRVSVGTLLGDRIVAKTVNSNHIVAAGLDAGVIKFGEMSGQRLLAGTVTSDLLSATIALIQKKLSVGLLGKITIDDTDGIKIVTDSGSIQFPADGGRPSVIGDFTALSATIQDELNILGDSNYISGTLNAASGISPPSQPPTLSNYWPNAPLSEEATLDSTSGITEGDFYGSYKWLNEARDQNGNYEYQIIQRSGGVETLLITLGNNTAPPFDIFRPTGRGCLTSMYDYGVSDRLNFILVNNAEVIPEDTLPTYKLYKYNADFTIKLAEYPVAYPTGLGDWDTPIIFGGLTVSGGATNAVVMYWRNYDTDKLCVRRYLTSNGTQNSSAVSTVSITDSPKFGFLTSAADIVEIDGVLTAWSKGSTLTRLSANDYPVPPLVSPIRNGGAITDLELTAVFLDNADRVWYICKDEAPVTLWCKYTFYDGNPGGVYGAGGETTPSPAKTFTKSRGAFMEITTAKAPYTGDPDDPDRIRVYLSSTNSNYQLQGEGEVGTNWTYLRKVYSGTAPPSTNSWDSRPGSSGRLRSLIGSLLDGVDQGIWDLNGTGAGRVGPWRWNSVGQSLMPSAKAHVDGAAITLATGTWKSLALARTLFSTDIVVSTVGGVTRLTINTAGMYKVNAKARFANNATGVRGVSVKRNDVSGTALPDVDVAYSAGSSATATTVYASAELYLDVGDYLWMQAMQSSGGNLALTTNAGADNYVFLQARRVG